MDSIFPCLRLKADNIKLQRRIHSKMLPLFDSESREEEIADKNSFKTMDSIFPSLMPKVGKIELQTRILPKKWTAFSFVWQWQKVERIEFQARILRKKRTAFSPVWRRNSKTNCTKEFSQKNWADLFLPSLKPRIEHIKLLTRILKNGQHFSLTLPESREDRITSQTSSKKRTAFSPVRRRNWEDQIAVKNSFKKIELIFSFLAQNDK